MNKIAYYYTSMSKQVFIILTTLFFLSRLAVFTAAIALNISGYAQQYNWSATFVLYLLYFAVCAFFFAGYKMFYTTYDDVLVTYHNRILRKSKSVDLTNVRKALLNKKGIYLYQDASETPSLFIPFWRLGYISPVGVNNFYMLLLDKGLEIKKTFTVLPGTGKIRKVSSVIYTGLALLVLGQLTRTVSLLTAILKAHL